MVALFQSPNRNQFRELEEIANGINGRNGQTIGRLHNDSGYMANTIEKMYVEAQKGDSKYFKALVNLGIQVEAAGFYYMKDAKFSQLTHNGMYLLHEVAKKQYNIAKVAFKFADDTVKDRDGWNLLGIMVKLERERSNANRFRIRKELPKISN
ncbi:MAG: hypothetical protein KGH66_01805 [Candidatus Micrarchaeota archaeon]|nr:hypothetical protein [Candidatus Micrarchaeota archaeon]